MVTMINEIIKSITDYTDYLRNRLNLTVSFSNIANNFEQYMHIFHPYNVHICSYCACMKLSKETRDICISKQFRVLAKSEEGAYYGMCWAGVEEFVFPVRHNGHAIAFISVSGYRGKLPGAEPRIRQAHKLSGHDEGFLKKVYSELSPNVPELEQLEPLISPLCLMFSMLYEQSPKTTSSEDEISSLYTNILNYIGYNYMQAITLGDIAESMHYSKSYIRQLFKNKSGISIHRYLTLVRIKRAKELLAGSSMPVTQVASAVGYKEPNYFANAFRKETGMSPRDYRKQHAGKYVIS